MGRQRGFVYITGQFNDVLMTVDNGKGQARMSIPVSKDRIMHGEEYETVRKYLSEFKGISKAMKAFRKALGSRANKFADRYLQSRLMKLGRDAITVGTGPLGEREFLVLANAELLKDVRLNKDEDLVSRFTVTLSGALSVNTDRNTATLTIPPFEVASDVKWPTQATHVRISLVVGGLPDFEYQGPELGYMPVVSGLVGSVGRSSTGLIAKTAGTHPGFVLTSSLPGLVVLGSNAGLVVSLEMDFVKVVNNGENPIVSGDVAGLLGIY